MRICEFSFLKPNPLNQKLSDYEIDFFAWSKFGDPTNHRLSLRKYLVTKLFEIYRIYSFSGIEEIVFEGSIFEVVDYADGETCGLHGNHTLVEICDHNSHSRGKKVI